MLPCMAALVRSARADEGPALQEIERLAGERFRTIGRPEVADDDPPALDVLASYAQAARSWVAVDDTDAPIGYVLVDVVDGAAHIEQVSVAPAHQGNGVGRALVDAVASWAGASGMASITLTTFTDVPWNAPLYRRLGFRALDDHEIGVETAGPAGAGGSARARSGGAGVHAARALALMLLQAARRRARSTTSSTWWEAEAAPAGRGRRSWTSTSQSGD